MRTVALQPAASHAAFKEQLESLRAEIRHYWERDSGIARAEREQTLSRLLRLDMAVERLLLTCRGSAPSRIAVDEFDRCCRALDDLTRLWPESERSARVPSGTTANGGGWRLAS